MIDEKFHQYENEKWKYFIFRFGFVVTTKALSFRFRFGFVQYEHQERKRKPIRNENENERLQCEPSLRLPHFFRSFCQVYCSELNFGLETVFLRSYRRTSFTLKLVRGIVSWSSMLLLLRFNAFYFIFLWHGTITTYKYRFLKPLFGVLTVILKKYILLLKSKLLL